VRYVEIGVSDAYIDRARRASTTAPSATPRIGQ
jgi:hypothetical protein